MGCYVKRDGLIVMCPRSFQDDARLKLSGPTAGMVVGLFKKGCTHSIGNSRCQQRFQAAAGLQ